MKYFQPYDQPGNPTAPYVDLDVARGVDGSIPPAAVFNALQAELLNVITAPGVGLTPSASDNTQLLQAIRALMPTPSGAPSDASLVHYSADSGTTNALDLTPSPAAASLLPGFTIWTVPVASCTGLAVSAQIHLSSGVLTKGVVRDDGGVPVANDLQAGRLNCLVYDGTRFRLGFNRRPVSTDGATILGDGLSTPLSAVSPIRAWGFVSPTGGLLAGFGASVARPQPGQTTITFSSPLADTNFALLTTVQSAYGQGFFANEVSGSRSVNGVSYDVVWPGVGPSDQYTSFIVLR